MVVKRKPGSGFRGLFLGVGDGAEAAYVSVGAYDEGEGEGVPVFVGVGWVVAEGFEGCPVFSVVAGDVGAVGAYGDPEFLGGVVGYGGAVAVGWVWAAANFP
jgi:hypothetical protein